MKDLIRVAARWARHQGVVPRVHPNGFIQLDLGDDGTRIATQRLHVWPDGQDIPKQSTATIIHDHRFDMRSTVITGTLVQHPCWVRMDPSALPFSHEIYIARYPEGRKESQLMPTGVKVLVTGGTSDTLYPGGSYTQSRYTFHYTNWHGLTATLMEKTGEDLDHDPRVLVPLGEEPDNTFVRSNVDEELIWNYIERALA